ncbi:hypothetical protein GCM10010168_22930 [Actinoplanes ianthinogenes]|uniref:DUF3626 domain-containing protein n=1 Tax=Actinoplanes ianthinogenes TaxID=122358 RepID=A0ABM7M8I6_9ACTN|nr:DUF3626 domain-containing protein [Actinoplanes ianthinogenes]BCJ47934.1 hypothetical protein Aiant_85910 [Actinoplanes ianthinogenes]GGR05187.1 hypothetical protein GCM10010168_22930 [Actinoplanes ianthinogenes]
MSYPSLDTSRAAAAVAHVRNLARGQRIDPSWRVTVHFHPDRLVDDMTILRAMATDGRYRSQFETGTSNGGLSCHTGGDRWRWESRLFGGAYDDAPPAARPVYGSLNHRHRPAGGSPRFGSAHLRLNVATLARTTFCYPDSVFEPVEVGTADRCALADLADADDKEPLDDYVEAHVHGGVVLARDVEALVLDPCFRDTEVEADAHLLGVPVQWHHGFRARIDDIAAHPGYRGPDIVVAAALIAREGILDARIIGAAVREGLFDEQSLKRVWHCTARFGHPDIRP